MITAVNPAAPVKTYTNTGLKEHRYPTHRNPETKTRIAAAAGSALSVAVAMIILAKGQNKNLHKIKDIFDLSYGVKEVTAVGCASVAGGVIAGCLADKKDDNIPKVKEGIYQIMNVVIPALCTQGLLNIMASTKLKNSRIAKIGAITAGITAGMAGASAAANFINDPNDNEKDRKITIKDVLANSDDAIGALVLAKVPFVEKLKIHRLIPVIFTWCGYRAGQSN